MGNQGSPLRIGISDKDPLRKTASHLDEIENPPKTPPWVRWPLVPVCYFAGFLVSAGPRLHQSAIYLVLLSAGITCLLAWTVLKDNWPWPVAIALGLLSTLLLPSSAFAQILHLVGWVLG
jgi:hypothetical protein